MNDAARAQASAEVRAIGCDASRFPACRSEISGALMRAEQKIESLMRGTAMRFRSGTTVVPPGEDHCFVYRLLQGWAGRTHCLADGREQITLIFLPGDMLSLESIFLAQRASATTALSEV